MMVSCRLCNPSARCLLQLCFLSLLIANKVLPWFQISPPRPTRQAQMEISSSSNVMYMVSRISSRASLSLFSSDMIGATDLTTPIQMCVPARKSFHAQSGFRQDLWCIEFHVDAPTTVYNIHAPETDARVLPSVLLSPVLHVPPKSITATINSVYIVTFTFDQDFGMFPVIWEPDAGFPYASDTSLYSLETRVSKSHSFNAS